MDDFKENNPDEEKEERISSTFDPNTEEVKNEMEELAKTFKRELDKVQAEVNAEETDTEGDAHEILIQSLEDIPVKAEKDEPEEIPEDELCECCNEKRRGTDNNPDSPYCNDCDEGLRHYPFDFLKVFLVLVVLALVFYSGYIFADHMSLFVSAQKADKLVSQNKLTSAIDAYADLANTMVNDNMGGEMIYKKEILTAYKMGYVGDIADIAAIYKSWELKLPHLKKVNKALLDAEELTITAQAAYTILSEYDVENPKTIPYDEALAKLTSLETSDIPETTAAATDSTTATTQASAVKAQKYNKAMIYYYKCSLARMCEKDIQIQVGFAEQIKSEYPDYVWLYTPILGDLYSKTGRDVSEICELIRSVDSEDYIADVFEIQSLRIKGEYDAAIKRCDEIISAGSEIDYEIYRNKALCYLATGDYDSAYSTVSKAYEANSYSIDVIDTFALCAAVLGKDDIYTQMQTTLTDNGYDLADSVKGYKAGTLTLDDILLKGDFDV